MILWVSAMLIKNKKFIFAVLLIGCVLAGYVLWLSLRPIGIVAVHQRNHYSDILVRDFPVTERGRIHWWLKNRGMLKGKFDIPKPDEDGFYSVIFWDFGEGYKETDGNDRLCFDDMKTEINCIDKNSLMMVVYSKNTGLYFRMNSGKYYLRDNGVMEKRRYE